MNKIPFTYNEILFEIWNYPTEFKRLVERMGFNKYHFYWCKEKSYMFKWSLIQDFMDFPEKYTYEYKLGDVVKKKKLGKNDVIESLSDSCRIDSLSKVNDVVDDVVEQLTLF
jgi:hypothetical protein